MMNRIIFMLAETAIHAGAGNGEGLIDSPIMRESHTGWPVIFGSAMKGALRANARIEKKANQESEDSSELEKKFFHIFGKSENAGNLLVGDARLLWLPIRSMTSHTLWVTCPAILNRFKSDCERLGSLCELNLQHADCLRLDEAIVHTDLHSRVNEEVYIEDHKVTTIKLDEEVDNILEELNEKLKIPFLKDRIIIVHDDLFAYLSQTATQISPQIKILQETKTTEDGTLRYIESLPPDTLMYCCMAGVDREGNGLDFEISDALPDKGYLQVGGHETTGMGWFKLFSKED